MQFRPTKTYTIDEARTRLEGYCAYQERCHQEVRNKLREMGMIPEVIDQILDSLLQDNFLNETRYAKAFSRGKFRTKQWGKVRITRELKMKGLKQHTINKGLKEIQDEAYWETFEELSRKRFQQITETNKFKKRKKLADYLLYRGWEASMVYEKAKELIP